MSETHGSVGSYVVHALDPREKSDFEAHLAVCESCRREVVEFSETAAQLGSLVETPPPPALRASLLSAIREIRPLPPVEREPGNEPAEIGRVQPPFTADPSDRDEPPVAVVDELAARRSRRPGRLLALAVAAAMVIALGLGGWVANLRQDQHAQTAESALEAQLETAPDVKYYRKTMKNGAPVTFVVSKSLNKALLIGSNVPSVGAKQSYQLWTLKFGTKVNATPDATFDGGPARKTWFTGNVAEAGGVAITVEPHGGSLRPHTENTMAEATL